MSFIYLVLIFYYEIYEVKIISVFEVRVFFELLFEDLIK